MKCPTCRAISGDDWEQCNGACPMPGSPHYARPASPRPGPDGWVPWSGGENPVPGQMVEWKSRAFTGTGEADKLDWGSDHIMPIIAFRLASPVTAAAGGEVEAAGAVRKAVLRGAWVAQRGSPDQVADAMVADILAALSQSGAREREPASLHHGKVTKITDRNGVQHDYELDHDDRPSGAGVLTTPGGSRLRFASRSEASRYLRPRTLRP